MVKVIKSIVIMAPVEKVFAYMRDAKSNLEWLPGIMEISDIHEEPGQVGSHFRWAYKMAGLRFEGETTLVEYIRDRRMVTEGKGAISSRWQFDYTPVAEGTRLDLDVEYTVPTPVLGKLAEKALRGQNEREAGLALSNVKAKMESQVAAP
jgi:carbon monoxide dehydrogenase subunit G